MSGALIASTAAGLPSTVIFVASEFVANGDAGNGASYKVPSSARTGDTVLFYSLSNSSGQGSSPPGAGWTNAGGSLGGGNGVYVKRMVTASDLTVTTTSSGGYLAFAVYRGAASFAAVSGTGFTRNQYHAGVTFFGASKPGPATARFTLSGNGGISTAVASDLLPPLVYANGTNYGQFTAVELRSQ